MKEYLFNNKGGINMEINLQNKTRKTLLEAGRKFYYPVLVGILKAHIMFRPDVKELQEVVKISDEVQEELFKEFFKK